MLRISSRTRAWAAVLITEKIGRKILTEDIAFASMGQF
jgi:hypothetical protein